MKNVRKCKNPICDRPVLGRSDKVYCCDGCRSSHYNDTKKDREPNPFIDIPRFQKNNREILRKIYNTYGDKKRISRNYLIILGYNFTYHTHYMVDCQHNFHECCFDYALKIIDEYWFEVCRSIEEDPNLESN